MALWLQGAIEEIGCEGEGCRYCPYQIYEDEETFACEGIDRWQAYYKAIELWRLLNQPEKAERLVEIMKETGTDEEGTTLMTLTQLKEAVSLFTGLREALLSFINNKHFNFDPKKIDWDMEEYSKLVTYWKNPDGTETYTLVNALYDAEETEYYLRGALRVGKPVLFDSFD